MPQESPNARSRLKAPDSSAAGHTASQVQSDFGTCPYCAEPVKGRYRYCKNCGRMLPVETQRQMQRPPLFPPWLTRYIAGAVAGGFALFAAALSLVLGWTYLARVIDGSGFFAESYSDLWRDGFLYFFSYQKIPITLSSDYGSTSFVYVATLITILIFLLMFLAGRLSAYIARPKRLRGAIAAGMSICIPYLVACLILSPFAKLENYEILKPNAGFIVFFCLLWATIFGAWGGARQYAGRAAIRQGLERLGVRSPEIISPVFPALKAAARIVLLTLLLGLVFYPILIFETAVPERVIISHLINESPSLALYSVSSSMGAPVKVYIDSGDEYYEGAEEYFERDTFNLAYGKMFNEEDSEFYGLADAEGRPGLNYLMLLGPMILFLYGGWVLAKKCQFIGLNDYLLALMTYSLSYAILMLLCNALSYGGSIALYSVSLPVYPLRSSVHFGLLFVLSFGWSIVLGLISTASLYRYERLGAGTTRIG